MIIKKPIRILIMRLATQHPQLLPIRPRPLRRNILLPHDAQEQRAGAIHDGDVRQAPVAIIRLETRYDVFVERMARRRPQRVVADARGRRAARPGGVLEEGVEGARGLDVEVEVDAAVVGEDEVAEGVDALDGVGVGGVGGEEPGVFGGDEVEGGFVCPELVGGLVIGDCDGREGMGGRGDWCSGRGARTMYLNSGWSFLHAVWLTTHSSGRLAFLYVWWMILGISSVCFSLSSAAPGASRSCTGSMTSGYPFSKSRPIRKRLRCARMPTMRSTLTRKIRGPRRAERGNASMWSGCEGLLRARLNYCRLIARVIAASAVWGRS
jgi:hypothetical protein